MIPNDHDLSGEHTYKNHSNDNVQTRDETLSGFLVQILGKLKVRV